MDLGSFRKSKVLDTVRKDKEAATYEGEKFKTRYYGGVLAQKAARSSPHRSSGADVAPENYARKAGRGGRKKGWVGRILQKTPNVKEEIRIACCSGDSEGGGDPIGSK